MPTLPWSHATGRTYTIQNHPIIGRVLPFWRNFPDVEDLFVRRVRRLVQKLSPFEKPFLNPEGFLFAAALDETVVSVVMQFPTLRVVFKIREQHLFNSLFEVV